MHEQTITSTSSAQTSLPKPAATITESEEEGEVVSGQSASPGRPSSSSPSSSRRPSEAVQAAVASAVASANITQPQTISTTTSDTSSKTTTTTTTNNNDDKNKDEKPSTLENEPVQPPAAETMSETGPDKSENNDTNALEEGEIDE